MLEIINLKDRRLLDKKSIVLICCIAAIAGCGGGGGGSGDGDGGGSGSGEGGENTFPSVQLNDGDVLSNGNSVISIPVGDNAGIATVSARISRQGRLEECRSVLDFTLVQDSLLEACLADQPTCSVDFIPGDDEVLVFPPPLYAPIGLEYELSFINRDGFATDPTTAVFCFDVGANAVPTPANDTFQLIFPGFVQRGGVSFNSRCERADGSDGVLVNDDDDEHITNTCLSAELVDLPGFASNLSTFSQSFQSNGGFRYEGLGEAPASTVDSFTYRVTDGVNPPSAPVTVQIVFSGENSLPIATNDAFTVAEDNPSQELDVLANDSDPDALPLTITSVFNGPDNGVANIRNGVLIDYTPNENFSGQDQFSYSIVDSGGLVVNANVAITVTGVNDPPLAQNDAISTNENVAVQINVLANDTDLEANTLSVSAIAAPANGTAVTGSNGQILYTPDANFFGIDPFEYTISDGNGGSDTATVVVTVNFINVPPVANEDNLSVDEDDVATIDVIANDTDADGDSLLLVDLVQPTNGVAEIVSDSLVRYTPNANYNGPDAFEYIISDGEIESSAQVIVVVTSVNDVPVAVDDNSATTENNAVAIDVTANDTDADEDLLGVASVTQANNGAVTISDDGLRVIYTPDALFSGDDAFTYTVTDGNGGADTATVSVRITDTNGAPAASNDSASTAQDTSVTIDVLDNDSDPDNDTLSLSIVTNAANGSAVVQGAAIVYTPDEGFDGDDSFTYTVTDPGGLTATAQVTVVVSDVNASPVAIDDSVGVNENTAITIDVLANDSDPDDGDAVSIASVGTPDFGSAAIQANAIVYTPEADFTGSDQFTYQISDGNGGTDTATVVVTVSDVNQPPLAVDDAISSEQDDPISIAVLANDSDPDGDDIIVQNVTQPPNGTASISANSLRVTYTPDANFSGTDSFGYTIEDVNGGTATANVTVTVIPVSVPVNDPPVAQPDNVSTQQNTPINIDVTANDTDPNGDEISLVSVTQPLGGGATFVDGIVNYTPDLDFTGDDSFTYVITDGNGADATGTVSVTVLAVIVNDPPVAQADSVSTQQNTPISIDVTSNDTDANGDEISLVSVTQPLGGSATFVDGIVNYAPDLDFTGDDSFTYEITDGNGVDATGTVSVTVLAVIVNDPPVAQADSVSTQQNTPISIDVTSNDTDANGDEISLVSVTQPLGGSATFVDGIVNYTPDLDFTGDDSFTYEITDGNGADATGTVSVTVLAVIVNDPPVAQADSVSTQQNTPISIDVTSNDTDANGDEISLVSVTQPLGGSATFVDGIVNYTPDLDFTGDDSFTYEITDGNGADATGTVSVTVLAVVIDTPPEAVDDDVTMLQGTEVVIDVLANDNGGDTDSLALSIAAGPVNGVG